MRSAFPRLLAWSLTAVVAVAYALAGLSLSARRDLALGRERLLAGDVTGAETAFTRARRWPGAHASVRAGLATVAARAGRTVAETIPRAELDRLAPEALVLSSLDEGRLDAADALASLARRAGHPLGALWGAAVALEQGDEAAARTLAAASPVPLVSRGLGRRLERALRAREEGASVLVLDRNGELAATVTPDGGLVTEPDALAALGAVRERLPPLPRGDAVRLTIDVGLSRLAREALEGRRGSIVLLEPRTGAVLAAVSDERTARREGGAAFTQRREPASIAKVLTSAAAYRAGVDADREIKRMTCVGVERYGNKPLWCSFPAGPLEGLDHALALSCNIAFANLGTALGTERMVAEYRLWGFDAPESALLGAAGRVHTPPRDPRQLADLSVGLEVADVTPLHAATLAAVLANDGHRPEPRLVAGVCGALGLHDAPLPLPGASDVLEPAVVRRLRRAMRAVAAFGTGVGLAPPGFPVAMKTGTAAEWRRGYHTNYIGFGPVDDPTVAFCIRVTNERSSSAVTRATREVALRLLQGLGDRRDALAVAARRQRAQAGHYPRALSSSKATRPRVETESPSTSGRAKR